MGLDAFAGVVAELAVEVRGEAVTEVLLDGRLGRAYGDGPQLGRGGLGGLLAAAGELRPAGAAAAVRTARTAVVHEPLRSLSAGSAPTGTGSAEPPRRARPAAALGARCLRAARRCERPRWMRLRTVPSLTPRVAAISS